MAVSVLLAAGLFSTPASAAAVDLEFRLKPGEDASCRVWSSGQVQWNLTVAQNGTDSSLITTPTYVFVDDATIQGPRGDGWTFILVATNSGNTTKAFDDQSSNNFATGDVAYGPPVPGSAMDLALYSGGHLPPAPPANVTIFLLPRIESENKSWYFNVTARTHRSGVTDIIKRVQLCVVIPPDPKFDMGNGTAPLLPITAPIQAAANSTVKVDFWIKNEGNTQDFFICNVSVPREDWTWRFEKGFFVAFGENRTNLTNLQQTIAVTVSVYVPPTAKARENSTVSLNCVSFKALTLNRTVFVYPPYVKIEVIQFFYFCGAIAGDSSKSGVPGDQLRYDYTVRNLGNGPDDGVATIIGDPSWQTVVTPETYSLPAQGDPGWEESAQFIVTIPIGTTVGTYDYSVNVTSTTPGTPICQMRFHVLVKQVYIPMATQPDFQYGQPQETIVFGFRVWNGGNFDDEYAVEVLNLSDWRVFLDPPVGRKLLGAGKDANFTATVIVPKDLFKAQVGTYEQVIRITSNYARQDIGQTISVSINLTIIILPQVRCSVDPPTTDKPLNPYSFPGGLAKANFLLEVTNTGNGGDAVNLSYVAPESVNVTLTPRSLSLTVLEVKAVLVSMEFPSSLPTGDYTIAVVARSQTNTTVTCVSTYVITIFHLQGTINPTTQIALQDPENPEAEIPPPAPQPNPVDQVEGRLVSMRVLFENHGDRAISNGTATVSIYDDFECPSAPIRATQDTCGSRLLTTWTLTNNLIVNGSVFVPYIYEAPRWMCFEEALCEANPPQPNAHRLRFVLTLTDEAVTTDNTAQAIVNVLPGRVVKPPEVAAPLPIIPIAAGLAIALMAGFFVWYNYLRTPKVDEELYASIDGGEGEAPAAAGPAAAPPPVVEPVTDAQAEEARRLYGDDYGQR